ncbi:hypothetical protein R6Q57_009227 [Mikania cordata]
MSAYLGDPPEKRWMFKSMNSIAENTDANGNTCLIGRVQWQFVIVTEQIIRECLQFEDKDSDPIELDQELIQSTIFRMRHEDLYPPTEKKLLHPYWRSLAHIVTQCLSRRKGGYDILNQTLSSCMVAIILGQDFNFSKMIFRDMYANIKGKRKEIFLAFPRFIPIIINKRHKNLVPTVGTLPLKRIKEDVFSYMKINKKGKRKYVGARPLEKFGRLFAGLGEEAGDQGSPAQSPKYHLRHYRDWTVCSCLRHVYRKNTACWVEITHVMTSSQYWRCVGFVKPNSTI